MTTISAEEFYKATLELAEKVKEFRPEILVPVMNGGMVPAAILGEVLKIKDVRPISIFRKGDERELVYDLHGDISGKRVLVVEDAIPSDRGAGFRLAKKIFAERGAIVKTASSFSGTNNSVDYYGARIEHGVHLFWKPSDRLDRF
ncbi:MAG: hypothetical protein ABH879_06955 [archaeon]